MSTSAAVTREQLRQPVTAIRACAQLAVLKLTGDSQRTQPDILRYLNSIVAETRRLEALLAAPRRLTADGVALDTDGWATGAGTTAQLPSA
jgi:hypothetical protein